MFGMKSDNRMIMMPSMLMLVVLISATLTSGVIIPQSFYARIKTDKLYPVVNEDFQMICDLIVPMHLDRSSNQIEYKWSIDDRYLHSGSELNFRPFKESDYGNYKCSIKIRIEGYNRPLELYAYQQYVRGDAEGSFTIKNNDQYKHKSESEVDQLQSSKVEVRPSTAIAWFNRELTLNCDVSGRWKDLTYNWYKNDVLTHEFQNRKQYRIESFSHNDLAEYKCEISGYNLDSSRVEKHSNIYHYKYEGENERHKEREYTRNYRVSVRPNRDTAMYDEPVELSCNVEGTESLSNIAYKWYKDEQLTHQTSKIFNIQSFSDNDLGKYTCEVTASSKHSNAAVKLSSYFTYHKSRNDNNNNDSNNNGIFELLVHSSRNVVYPGDFVVMTCSFKPYVVNAQYKWYKDGVEINRGQIHTITSYNSAKHSGQYRCVGVATDSRTKSQVHREATYTYQA